jgi:hypothetical protein
MKGRHDMIMWVKVGVKWLVKSNYGTYLFVEVVNSPAEAREWSWDVGRRHDRKGRTFGIGWTHLRPLAEAVRSRQLSQIYCFKGLYADQHLNVQLTDVAVILKARMLYDVYSLGTGDEVGFSVLRLKMG